MKIRTNANHHFFNIHCPSCGSDIFYHPRTNLEGWNRCKVCGIDIMQRYSTTGAVEIVGVVEEYKNKIHDKFKAGKTYPQKPGNPAPTTMYSISEGECERIEEVNENLPTDELELEVRRILSFVRERRIKQ